jgi:hypothetical protein
MRVETVRRVIHERNRRAEFFRQEMFTDPAWDVLLEIYASELSGSAVTMSRVGMISNMSLPQPRSAG